MPPIKPAFYDELVTLLNKHSMENGSDTPDYVLANFICTCLIAFDSASNAKLPYMRLPTVNERDRAAP